MQKLNTTAYHPQADRLVENFNRTLRTMLAKYAAKFGVNWDEHLHHLRFLAYQTKPHDSTGESPFSCYMAVMPGYPVRPHCPHAVLHIKLILMIIRLSWCMDCQQPGSWPEMRYRDLKRNRRATMIVMLSGEIFELVIG